MIQQKLFLFLGDYYYDDYDDDDVPVKRSAEPEPRRRFIGGPRRRGKCKKKKCKKGRYIGQEFTPETT